MIGIKIAQMPSAMNMKIPTTMRQATKEMIAQMTTLIWKLSDSLACDLTNGVLPLRHIITIGMTRLSGKSAEPIKLEWTECQAEERFVPVVGSGEKRKRRYTSSLQDLD